MKLRCPYLATNLDCTVPPTSYTPTQAHYKTFPTDSVLISSFWGSLACCQWTSWAEPENKGNEMKRQNTAFLAEEMHNLPAVC